MRWIAPILAFFAVFALQQPVDADSVGPRPVELGRIDGLQDILLRGGAILLRADAGDYGILPLAGGQLAMAPIAPTERPPVPSDIIPHAPVVSGARNITAAWLAGPTGRYGHGALGDAIEASALKVEMRDGRILSYRLAADSVFEDLTPRLADLDGDGSDEIIVVRSYADAGAALAVFGLRAGELAPVAESQPVGQPNRWLNPVGAGDFDGDGRTEIAVVRTPHIGGILILYRIEGERLVEIARRPGYSTHAIGSTVLGMAAVLDLDGDGADDILLPDQTRRELLAVGYAGGTFRSIWKASNRDPIVTAVVAADVDGTGGRDVVYGLADGSVWLLPR